MRPAGTAWSPIRGVVGLGAGYVTGYQAGVVAVYAVAVRRGHLLQHRRASRIPETWLALVNRRYDVLLAAAPTPARSHARAIWAAAGSRVPAASTPICSPGASIAALRSAPDSSELIGCARQSHGQHGVDDVLGVVNTQRQGLSWLTGPVTRAVYQKTYR